MSKLLTRRKLITTGLATAGGVSGLAVAAIDIVSSRPITTSSSVLATL
jgi:hypothetical protein